MCDLERPRLVSRCLATCHVSPVWVWLFFSRRRSTDCGSIIVVASPPRPPCQLNTDQNNTA